MTDKLSRISRVGISCLKNADNPYFNSKYADLATVVQALKAPLEAEKLGYYFTITNITDSEGNPSYWEVEISVFDLENGKVIATSAFPITCLEPQKFGSNVTYAKRYLLTTVFNVIAEEDDDGNATIGARNNIGPKEKREPKVLNQAKDFFK